jgi:two-component system nitrate/nitrite response regulator NarL
MSGRIRTLIADDHAPTRVDVRAILSRDDRFEVCAEAADASTAVAAAVESRPDLCLLDVYMPGSGVAACREISSRLPTAKVVMLTVSRGDRELFAALRSGASGYLLKDADERVIPDLLARVHAGEAALSGPLVGRVLAEFRDSAPHRRATLVAAPFDHLTSREWQVLELLRLELSTAEVARRLFISTTTVRDHVASITKKLGVPDRQAAVRLLEQP